MIDDVARVENDPRKPTKSESRHDDDHVLRSRDERGKFVLFGLKSFINFFTLFDCD